MSIDTFSEVARRMRGCISQHVMGCVGDWWFLVHAPIDLSNLGVLAGVGWQTMKVESCCLDDCRDALTIYSFLSDEYIRCTFWHSLFALKPRLYQRGEVLTGWYFDYDHVDPLISPWGYHVVNELGQHSLDPRRWLSEG